MQNNLPTWLQSSVDPQSISLTYESAGKFLMGLVAIAAVMKGLDPQAAQSQAQALLDQGAFLASSAYAAYHAAQTLYGGLRKLVVYLSPAPTTTKAV